MSQTIQAATVVERTYRATVEELWALWTTKDGFESWWGPEQFRVDVHKLEAREGGALDYDMVADTPEAVAAMKEIGQPVSHATHGVYAAFRPHSYLRLVHVIDFLAGKDPYEVTIEVGFAAAGDQARMTVTLHPHPDETWTRMSIEGFTSQLTKLDRRFGWQGPAA